MIGINVQKNSFDDFPPFEFHADKVISPLLDLGLSMGLKNHAIGLTYTNVFSSFIKSAEYDAVKETSVVLYYSYSLILNEKLKLLPRVIISSNLSDVNLYLNPRIIYNNKLTAGLYYDSFRSFGISASIRLWKVLEIGFASETNKDLFGNMGLLIIGLEFE